MSYNHSGLSVI